MLCVYSQNYNIYGIMQKLRRNTLWGDCGQEVLVHLKKASPRACFSKFCVVWLMLHFHNYFHIHLSACEVVGHGILVVAYVAYPVV